MKPKNQKVWTNDHYGLDHQALEYLELILREKNDHGKDNTSLAEAS